jgi:hypothetical protein
VLDEVERARGVIETAWTTRGKQRAVYDKALEAQLKRGRDLAAEVNILVTDRNRLEAAQVTRSL